MKDLKASDVMVRPVVSAKKNASARDVALQLLTGLYSGMPVTDEEGNVIGVITELDLLHAVMEGKELVRITAGDIMAKDPFTADVNTSILSASPVDEWRSSRVSSAIHGTLCSWPSRSLRPKSSNGHERGSRLSPEDSNPPCPPLRKGGRGDFHGKHLRCPRPYTISRYCGAGRNPSHNSGTSYLKFNDQMERVSPFGIPA
jgi:hypothetical protein